MDKYQPLTAGNRYHVYNRAAAKKDIFTDEADCIRFLSLTKKHLPQAMDLLSYAILPNHFHLYVAVKLESQLPPFYQKKPSAIGASIGHLQNAYAKYYRHKTTSIGEGAVFQGRYKRIRLTTTDYQENIVHYINGNALHHGLVVAPLDYPFTSLQELIYSQVKPFVNREMVYQDFGGEQRFVANSNMAMKKKALYPEWEFEPED